MGLHKSFQLWEKLYNSKSPKTEEMKTAVRIFSQYQYQFDLRRWN